MADIDLRNKVAIVTGASSGIGRSTAIALAGEGVRVALAARNAERLTQVEREVRDCRTEAFARPTDATVRSQVEDLVQDTLSRFGCLDIVVCSAGQYVQSAVRDSSVDDFERALAINFYGCLFLVLAALPAMLKQGSGHLVAVSSVDGKKGLPGDAPYVASKFALTGFMDVLRQELRGTGVQALTILPGRVDTRMIGHLDVPWASRKIPSERVARTIVRGLRQGRSEMIVPWAGPKSLVICNSISPRLADWFVRRLGLQGTESSPRQS